MLSKVPAPIRRYVDKEDKLLAIGAAWVLAPFFFTVAGFYLGTIVGVGEFDMQMENMRNGGIGALIGLLIGVVFAVVVTAVYPSTVDRDYATGVAHQDDLHDPTGVD